MNAFANRDLRDHIATAGAALCAAPGALSRCPEQQNRGVSDPRSGARDRPTPCSGVAHATAVRFPSMRRANGGAWRRYNEPSACTRAPERRVHMRAHRAQPRRRRVRHVEAGRAAIPHEMIELCSPPSMRSAPLTCFARACGAASALTASARSSAVCTCGWRPLHRICRARLDGEMYGDYSADVFSGVSTTPLRLDTQADSGPIAVLQRETAPPRTTSTTR